MIRVTETFDNAWFDYSQNLDNEGKDHKYTVYAEDNYQTFRRTTDDPKEALKLWFKYSTKFPLNIAILTDDYQYAKELLDVATDDYIIQLYYDSHVPYKLDWLLNGVKKGAKESDFKGDWGESIFPFSFG